MAINEFWSINAFMHQLCRKSIVFYHRNTKACCAYYSLKIVGSKIVEGKIFIDFGVCFAKF